MGKIVGVRTPALDIVLGLVTLLGRTEGLYPTYPEEPAEPTEI